MCLCVCFGLKVGIRSQALRVCTVCYLFMCMGVEFLVSGDIFSPHNIIRILHVSVYYMSVCIICVCE